MPSTQAHAGHILLPIDPMDRLGGEVQEREKLKRAYVQAWKRPDTLGGRVHIIDNLPFTQNGKTVQWSPIQVAVMFVRKGLAAGFDTLRVLTPPPKGEQSQVGDRALEKIDFSVRELYAFIAKNPESFPSTTGGKYIDGIEKEAEHERGTVKVEDAAANTMPQRWGFTPTGLFVPGGKL